MHPRAVAPLYVPVPTPHVNCESADTVGKAVKAELNAVDAATPSPKEWMLFRLEVIAERLSLI